MTTRRSSTPSSASLTSSHHLRPPLPSTIRTNVVTTPPWARDEPPSPTALQPSSSSIHLPPSEYGRPSDVGSHLSAVNNMPSRWWSFTTRRPRDPPSPLPQEEPKEMLPSPTKSEKRPFKFPLPQHPSWRDATNRKERPGTDDGPPTASSGTTPSSSTTRPNGLHITLPPQPAVPFTLSHNRTPGWDTPWTSRPGAQGPFNFRQSDLENEGDPDSIASMHSGQGSAESGRTWKKRRKRFRNFILHNTYVPLLFRFVNLTFTAAALALAVRIRQIERSSHASGAVGSSPTIVIIFAPLTIVHIMYAVYLEYFGRPLGLWRTSAKMFHTLFEVVFICAWSAAVSLCFDNFFTSLIPCAPAKRISWYNELPRPNIAFLDNNIEDSTGDRICDDQLALICLVTVALITYCINLVISLFRIVEKVKYHPGSSRGAWRPS